jgi:hypothetical protein
MYRTLMPIGWWLYWAAVSTSGIYVLGVTEALATVIHPRRHHERYLMVGEARLLPQSCTTSHPLHRSGVTVSLSTTSPPLPPSRAGHKGAKIAEATSEFYPTRLFDNYDLTPQAAVQSGDKSHVIYAHKKGKNSYVPG